MTEQKSFVFRFGDVEVRERKFLLMRGGEVVPVEPKAFRVLLFLLRNPGRLVTKDEIVSAVWNDASVSDNSLTRSVATLRRLLGDDSREPRYIATVPTVGYRFLPSVEISDDFPESLESLPSTVPAPSDSGRVVSQIPHSSVVSSRWWLPAAGALVLLLAVGLVLWSRRGASQAEFIESQLTRHSSDNPLSGAVISPDGKYLLFADTVGLHITELQTGEVRDIQRQSEPSQKYIDWNFKWFPDGSRFLANEFDPDRPPVIWRGSVLAARLEKVRENAIAWTFSPDSSSIVITKPTKNNGPMSEMWLMDTSGNDLRLLDNAGETNAFGFVQWSPDGNRIAYLRYARKSGEFQVSMESRDFKGGPSVVLLADNALRSLYWLQDGRLLYVLGENDRTKETCNYWAARLDAARGTFSAAPRQLTRNKGFCVDTTSATSDSKKLVFLKRSFEVSVYIADLNLDTKRISPPRPLTSTEGQEWPTAWTPDSREVVFASNRGSKMGFFRYPFTGGEVSPILTGIESSGLGNLLGRVTPDGAFLLYEPFPEGYVPGTQMDLKRVSMAGGKPEVVLRDALFDVPSCALAPARLCAIATVAKDQLVFWSVDPVSGRGPELGRFKVDWKSDYGWQLSPDGTRIAIQRRGGPEIYVLSIGTHTLKTISIRGWDNGISLDWAADGSGFFICTLKPRAILLHVDLEGHATQLWEPKGSTTTWALPSPDGQHIAMPSGVVNSNAWMIQQF